MATAQAIRLLEELRIEVNNARAHINDSNTYYALVGRVNDALEGLQDSEHCETREKREKDAQVSTRQDASGQRTEQSRGRSTRQRTPPQGKERRVTISNPPVTPPTPKTPQPWGKTGLAQTSKWAAVARQGSKERPGDVDLRKDKGPRTPSPRTPPLLTARLSNNSATSARDLQRRRSKSAKRQTTPTPTPQIKREEGILPQRINREADRLRQRNMTGAELLQDIRQKAGTEAVNKIMAARMPRESKVKIWLKGPGAKQALENLS